MDFDIKISTEPIDYEIALKIMQDRREKIINGTAKSLLWLLEHNDVYTAGRNANQNDLLDKTTKVIDVDRGGKFTYHGKGQRICYIIADLRKFNNGELDIRKFINAIENTIIDTLQIARVKFPGSPASLNALSKKFEIDLAGREEKGHGALLDSDILADVFIKMCADDDDNFIVTSNKEEILFFDIIKRESVLQERDFEIEQIDFLAHQKILEQIKSELW